MHFIQHFLPSGFLLVPICTIKLSCSLTLNELVELVLVNKIGKRAAHLLVEVLAGGNFALELGAVVLEAVPVDDGRFHSPVSLLDGAGQDHERVLPVAPALHADVRPHLVVGRRKVGLEVLNNSIA